MAIPAASMVTFEIALKGSIGAGGGDVKNIANIFHYRRTAVAVDVNKDNVAAAFEADILPTIVAALNNRASLTQITVRCVDDATDAEYSATIAETGAVAGDGLSNFNCVTVRLKTAVRGRSGMGSKHFAPLSEADGDDDVLTGAGLTRWQAVRDVLDNAFVDADGNNWVPVVLSRKLSQLATNPTTVVKNDVTSCVLNKTYGTMKRRKVRTVT